MKPFIPVKKKLFLPKVDNMKEEVGVFLVNTKGEILLLHSTYCKWRSWKLPSLFRYKKEPLDNLATTALTQYCGITKKPSNIVYLGISKHNVHRHIFHGFCHILTNIPKQFNCNVLVDDVIKEPYLEIDGYRWIRPERIGDLIPQIQRDQLEILQEYLVRVQERQPDRNCFLS